MTIEEVLKGGNYHLIDVREPMELQMDGELENAVNIPMGELEDRKGEVESLQGPKIFFCRSGNRSGKAVEYFNAQGFSECYNGGGYEEMKNKVN